MIGGNIEKINKYFDKINKYFPYILHDAQKRFFEEERVFFGHSGRPTSFATPYGMDSWIKKYFLVEDKQRKVSLDTETRKIPDLFFESSKLDHIPKRNYTWDKHEMNWDSHEVHMEALEQSLKTKEPKMYTRSGEVFRGTATHWYSPGRGLIPVSKLDSSHLKNIIDYLKGRAKEALEDDQPYPLYKGHKDGGFVENTPRQLEVWLLENCFTYQALKLGAKNRGIWDYTNLSVVLPMKETTEKAYTEKAYSVPIQYHNQEQQANPYLNAPVSSYLGNLENMIKDVERVLSARIEKNDKDNLVGYSELSNRLDTQMHTINTVTNSISNRIASLENKLETLRMRVNDMSANSTKRLSDLERVTFGRTRTNEKE